MPFSQQRSQKICCTSSDSDVLSHSFRGNRLVAHQRDQLLTLSGDAMNSSTQLLDA